MLSRNIFRKLRIYNVQYILLIENHEKIEICAWYLQLFSWNDSY